MKKHTCKNCNSIFEYCRGCLLSPIPYKDAGYCSKSCYEASKKVVEFEPIVEEITTVEIEESIIEDEINTSTEDIQLVVEEISVEPLADVEGFVETTTPTIKNETYNAYKKKKKKHR